MNSAKRILLSAAAIAAVAAVPASASKPADHPSQAKGPKPAHTNKGKRCATRKHAYVAAGVVQDGTALTKNADGTYDGTLVVAVSKTNRHGRPHKGTTQTYTLDDAKVSLPDTDGNGTVDGADAVTGQLAKVIGKITFLPKKCDATGFTPAATIRKAKLTAAPAPAPTAPEQPQAPAGS